MCLVLLCFSCFFFACLVARVREWLFLYVVFSCVVSLFVFGVNVLLFVCVCLVLLWFMLSFVCFVARV